MRTIIVYSSQTGFTKKYAEWLAEKLGAEIMTFKDAHKKDDKYFDQYDAIIYGGWVAVEKIHKADWFTSRIDKWHGKKLAMFCVGASPARYSGVDNLLNKSLTDEQKKFAKVFYCEGGLNYEKMSLSSKMLMKTFAAMLNSKKDKTPDEIAMAEHVSKSGDYTDKKFIEPIAAYITQ
ncbi:flavodoxin domain-containing protein [Ruminococcus flavefaciens]|uniref:flavodoxin domain-containing protein n=1 Tax=Ruminococcus flavefaciens TaxID=1265 RepID=UPI0026EE148A|nr:flavodoxin domain-containing protein [Ruminococcus flavefaciens]